MIPACASPDCGAPLERVRSTRRYCSKRCKDRVLSARYRAERRARRGPTEPPSAPRRCWAWPQLQDVLAEGEASVELLTYCLFDGDTSLVNRKLVARMLHGLSRADREYRGGPYVVRVRDGVYALARSGVEPARDRLRRALGWRVRTYGELLDITGVCEKTLTLWLAEFRATGELREEYAPRDYAQRDGKVRAKVYWLRGSEAGQRWAELKCQRRRRASASRARHGQRRREAA